MLLTGAQLALVGVAGFGAGVVNGIAGGGSLLSFPALLAVGAPALSANVTSTVGIWPGYIGGSAGFGAEIRTQKDHLRQLLPATVLGSLAGSILLLVTPGDAFRSIAPYLILLACALFGVQPLLARRLAGRQEDRHKLLLVLVTVTCVYGGYFGAGLGVLLLAVLGVALEEPLKQLSGLRAAIQLLVNTISAVVFALTAPVIWTAVAAMAGGSLAGGYAGARLAKRIPVMALRVVVICFGVAAAVKLLV